MGFTSKERDSLDRPGLKDEVPIRTPSRTERRGKKGFINNWREKKDPNPPPTTEWPISRKDLLGKRSNSVARRRKTTRVPPAKKKKKKGEKKNG